MESRRRRRMAGASRRRTVNEAEMIAREYVVDAIAEELLRDAAMSWASDHNQSLSEDEVYGVIAGAEYAGARAEAEMLLSQIEDNLRMSAEKLYGKLSPHMAYLSPRGDRPSVTYFGAMLAREALGGAAPLIDALSDAGYSYGSYDYPESDYGPFDFTAETERELERLAGLGESRRRRQRRRLR